jgi:hypothetical protein
MGDYNRNPVVITMKLESLRFESMKRFKLSPYRLNQKNIKCRFKTESPARWEAVCNNESLRVKDFELEISGLTIAEENQNGFRSVPWVYFLPC